MLIDLNSNKEEKEKNENDYVFLSLKSFFFFFPETESLKVSLLPVQRCNGKENHSNSLNNLSTKLPSSP